MQQQDKESFIGTKLKAIPHSHLLYFNPTQILLNSKRQIIKLDTINQTLVYSNIDDQKPLSTTYHQILQLYIILTQKSILAVNNQGQLIKKLDNQQLHGSKFIFISALEDGYYGVPNERQDFLIYIKGDNLCTAKIKVNYQRQLIKGKCTRDVGIQYGNMDIHESPQYIQHSKHLIKQNILLLWNTAQCYVYSLPKTRSQQFARLHIYPKICRRQNQALDITLSSYYKIMIVSYESGVIKIYNFDHTRKYIQELRGHQSNCSSLYIPQNNQHFLYSAAVDNTVKIWNLRDYQEVYSLQLNVLIHEVYFITEKLLFINSNEIKQKSYLCQLNTNLLDPIVNQNKSGHLIKMKCNREWCMSIYENNYIQFFRISGNGNGGHHKRHQKIEYPEKYGLIRDIYQIDVNNYIIALEKGFSMLKLNKDRIYSQKIQLKQGYKQSVVRLNEDDVFLEQIHQTLGGTYIFSVIQDWKNIPLSIKVTAVYFHQNIWLPKWDSTTQQQVIAKANPSIYCVLGTSKGQIFFVDIDYKNTYYTKVQFHSCEVILIRELKQSKIKQISNKGELYFISIDIDKQISIWKISHNQTPKELINIKYNKDFTFIQIYQNYIVLGEKSGQFSIIQIQILNDQVLMLKSNSTGGHLRSVICGDFMSYQGCDLFLSGGEDSVIKIWKGIQKEMIYQLKLFGIVNTVNFIHCKLDMIVCHNQQISFLRVQKLKNLNRADQKLAELVKRRNFQKGIQFIQNQDTIVKNTINFIQKINIRTFFFVLKQIYSPLSPRSPKKHIKIKNRQAIDLFKEDLHDSEFKERIFFNEINKGIALMPLVKSERPRAHGQMLHATSQLSQIQRYAQPSLTKNIISSDRLYHKTKRFHIKSSNIDEEQLFVLPRLNIKNPLKYTKKAKFQEKSNDELLEQLRQAKQKAFSYAGRLKQKR